MPPVSQAQRAWAQSNKDTDPAAAEFAAADPGGKLPAKVKDGKPVGSKPASLFRGKKGS